MTIAFLILVALSCAAVYPAFLISSRRGSESRWLVVAPLPAVIVWVALTASGFGAQSLANVIEVFALFGIGVVLAYVKVFGFDKVYKDPRASTLGLIIVLCVLAMALRAAMPTLPE